MDSPIMIERAAQEAHHPHSGVHAVPQIGKRFFRKRTLVSFLLAIGLFVLAFRSWHVSLSDLEGQLATMNWILFALAFAVYATAFPIRALRWRLMLNNVGMDAKLYPLGETIFLSWFVNCVVPAKLGDVYRAYLMRKNEKLPVSATLGTIFSERIIDFTFLFAVLVISGFLVLQDKLTAQVTQIFVGGGVLIAGIAVTLVIMRFHGKRIVSLFSHRVQDVYHKFADGTFGSFKAHRAEIACLTVLCWLSEFGRLWLVTHALGVQLPAAIILFALAGVSFSLVVPTPGGLGAAEAVLSGLMILLGGPFGVTKALGLAIAIMDRVVSYWSLVVVGLPTVLFSKRTR